jgi:hypothetical protein
MTEVNAAAYQETRHRVYDLVREWEDVERSDPAFRNPAIKAHFERLAGPYGRAYYYMLKEQQKAE